MSNLKFGDKVNLKDYETCLDLALFYKEKNRGIQVSSRDVYSISKNRFSNIPKILTISAIGDACGYETYWFQETTLQLYSFMVEPLNKYVVKIYD